MSGYKVTIRNSWSAQEKLLQTANGNKLRLAGDPEVTLDVDAISSFTFDILPTHPRYADILPLNTFVKVYRPDGGVIFDGRVLKPTEDTSTEGEFKKSVTCEGILAFLHDSYQEWGEWHNMTPTAFLQHLIDVHNTQVDEYKRMTLGTVNVTNSTDNVYRYTEDDKDTYDTIKDKLLDRLGGELQVRNVKGRLYLDYLNTIGGQGKQELRLGNNILSMSRVLDPTSMYSIIKPLGATIQEDTTATTDATQTKPQKRINIKNVNNGSYYIEDAKKIAQMGRVVKTVSWDDVKVDSILLQKGKAELANQQFSIEQIEISAIDLALMTQSKIDEFSLGNSHRLFNPLFGIDEYKRIIKMTIHINQVQSSTMNVGDKILSQEQHNLKVKKAADSYNRIQYQMNAQGQIIQKTSNAVNELTKKLANMDSGLADGMIIYVSDSLGTIDWKTIVNNGLALAVISVQRGSDTEDKTYQTNITEANNAFANYAVSADFKAVSVEDAETEASNFYSRTQTAVNGDVQPRFYMIDIRESSMSDMQSGITAYMDQLNSLGIPDSRIVLYLNDQNYETFNLDISRASSICLSLYGADDGTITNSQRPAHPYDLWEFTTKGAVSGISTNTVAMSAEPSIRFKENFLS